MMPTVEGVAMNNSQGDLKQSLEQARKLRTLFERRAALLEELEALDDEIQRIGADVPSAQAKKKGQRKTKTQGDDKRQLRFRFEGHDGAE